MGSGSRSIGAVAIAASEAHALFAPLLKYDAVLLAVSGGVDSMAMLELVAGWSAETTAPPISVATVDHGLRPQSREEAAFVAARCAVLGLAHATLEWLGEKPDSGIANAARDARYALLLDYAVRVGGDRKVAVVTAHTEDDQAETLLMRLARGSGVDGLAAMATERPLCEGSDVALVRPLLGVAKPRLKATLEARGLSWREDASNLDRTYERVRVRSTLARLAEDGLSTSALATTARRARDARGALGFADRAFESSLSLDFNNDLFALFARAPFDAAPPLLRQRQLARLIQRFGGDTAAPDLAEMEDLTARIAATAKGRFTLGGAVVTVKPGCLLVWREAGRIAKAETPLAPGAAILWDNRFWIRRNDGFDMPLRIRPLGRDGAKQFELFWPPKGRPPAAALEAAPAVWFEKAIIAAPTLAAFAMSPQHSLREKIAVITATPVVRGCAGF